MPEPVPLPIVARAQDWYRIHPLDRDPLDSRIGALHLAGDPHAAFLETFGCGEGVRTVTLESLSKRGLARVRSLRPLLLLDLGSNGSSPLGSLEAFPDDRGRSDGVLHCCAGDPARVACALFDRVAADLVVDELGALSERRHAAMLGAILDAYGFGLIRAGSPGRRSILTT